MDEARTRREIIDRRLKQAGWGINDPSQVGLEFDIYLGDEAKKAAPNPESEQAGHQYSDYLLLEKGAAPLAVVETKKTSKDARVGKEQALQYAENIQKTQVSPVPKRLTL